MAMKRCPVCGEKYSDTYKRCPFCEEEEELRSGNAPRRQGGHRVSQTGPNLLSPILIVAILVMVCVLVYLLFGDTILDKLGVTPQSSSGIPAASMSEPAVSSGAASSSAASSGAAASSGESGGTGADLSGLPETLQLSKKDFTMRVGDIPVTILASGGGGSYTWSSSDDGVASVDANGAVTAISAGTVTVTATDGSAKGTCIVRVKGTGTPNTGTASGPLALSHADATIGVGESFTISVSGTSSAVTWKSSDSAVASVSGGKVTGVSGGRATISATVDGKTLNCIVRVK